MPATRPSTPRGELVDPTALDVATLEAWRELGDSARHPNVFSGPDLLVPAVRHLADGPVRLLVVPGRRSATATTRPGLVMPVATTRRHRRLPWRAAVGWQHTHHFLGTPLVAPDFGVAGWRAALDVLAAAGRDPWLVLPQVDADVARDVEAAARDQGRVVRRLAEVERPTTHRRPTDDYLERQLSGSRRKELRRVGRRLGEALGGELVTVDLVAARGLEEALALFLRLEAAGWKGDDGGAIARNPAERTWFLEACRNLAPHDGLDVWGLCGPTGDPVAIAVDLRAGDTAFTFKIAYDEDHAAHSPGLLLAMEELHRFHAGDAALLDSCAAPGHPMATRLHPDRRALVTLAVALGGVRGDLAVRSAPALLRAEAHARDRLHDVRRRVRARRGAPADAPSGQHQPVDQPARRSPPTSPSTSPLASPHRPHDVSPHHPPHHSQGEKDHEPAPA